MSARCIWRKRFSRIKKNTQCAQCDFLRGTDESVCPRLAHFGASLSREMKKKEIAILFNHHHYINSE